MMKTTVSSINTAIVAKINTRWASRAFASNMTVPFNTFGAEGGIVKDAQLMFGFGKNK